MSPARRASSSSLWNCTPGLISRGEYGGQRRHADDAPRQAQRIGGDAAVGLGRQVVGQDRGRVVVARRADAHMAARLRVQVAHAGGEGVARCSGSPKASSDSGCTWYSTFGHSCSADERVKQPSCDGAMLIGPLRDSRYCKPICALPNQRVGQRVERAHALHREHGADLQVVLQVARRRPGVRAAARRRALQPVGRARCPTTAAAAACRPRRRPAPPRVRQHAAAVPLPVAHHLDAGARAAPGRRPSNRRVTCAPVHTCRLRRCRTGRRNALLAFQRTPLRWLTSK